MRKALLLSSLTAALLSLTACAPTVCQPDIQNNYVAPPGSLMVPVPVEAPPDQKTYATLPWKARSDLWESKYDAQTGNVATANRHFGALQDWTTQQNAIYAGKTTGSTTNASGTNPKAN